MKYTILLMYPDYLTDNFGQESYLAHVEADTIEEAIERARYDAAEGQVLFNQTREETGADFHPILAVGGWLDDMLIR